MASSSAHLKNTHDKNAHVKNDHDKNTHAKNVGHTFKDDHHDKNAHTKNVGHTSKDDHHDKNAHAKNVGHTSKDHPDKNAHAKNVGHTSKDDHHDKNVHAKNVGHTSKDDHHDKNSHVKNVGHTSKDDHHDKNAHAKNVGHTSKDDHHDKNAHAKNVGHTSSDHHDKNAQAKNVGHTSSKDDHHDKTAHANKNVGHTSKDDHHDKNAHAKNVGHTSKDDHHDKNAHAKNYAGHASKDDHHDKNVIHAKNDYDYQVVHPKNDHHDKNAHAKNNRFLARCPVKGEHQFMVRDGETTEHFWCDVCRQDGSGRRYKCEHCNYRLHESCYTARKEMKCPWRPRDGHKYLTRDAPTPFWCDGCREIGVGIRFKCESCFYRLHEKCFHLQEKCKTSTRPPTTTNANFPGKVFHFLLQHPGSYPGQVCSPCGRDVCGFVFKATDGHGKSVFLHPHCSDVEKEWNQLGMKFLLLDHKSKAKCMCCKKGKASGWAYVSDDEKYSVHIVCVMELIIRGWKEGQLEEARLKNLENVDLVQLAEQLEKNTGFPWKKIGLPLLKFVAGMILSNAPAIGTLLIAVLSL